MQLLIGGYRAAVERLRFDPRSGALTPIDAFAAPTDSAFVALSSDGRHLYAASEVDHGVIAAWRLDGERAPTPIAGASSGGATPCHLGVHPSGRWLLCANYGSGTVAVLPTSADGVGEATAVIEVGANAHMALLHADGERVLVPCRGSDHVAVLRLDVARGTARVEATVAVPRGSGPRHVAWHPDGRAYLACEDASTLIALRCDGASFAVAGSASMLPVPVANAAAHVVVHPSGRWAYASNRGHDSIAVFALDEVRPRPLEHAGGVRTPRHFALDPSGRWLIAAGQATDELVVFAVGDDGRLAARGRVTCGTSPCCVVFLP